MITDEDLRLARSAVEAGRVIAMPTDTVYGLAVNPRVAGAVAELFRVKGRPESVALPILVGDPEEAAVLAELDRRGQAVIAAFWPGPLTIVLHRGVALADVRLGGDESTIGLRCPASDVSRRLLRATGPLAVTSANRHGEPPCGTAEEVRRAFGLRAQPAAGAQPAGRQESAAEQEILVLDGGRCGGRPSTVVSLTGERVTLLRAGAIPVERIEEVWLAAAT